MEGSSKFRRRQVLIDQRFQYQYMLIWFTTGIGVVVLGVGAYIIWKVFSEGRYAEFSGAMVKTAVSLGLFTLLFCALMGLLSVYLTHRVSGAAYHLERTLRAVRSGDFEQEFRLRKQDYLQSLAQELNDFVGSLRDKRKDLTQACDLLDKAITELRNSGKFIDTELRPLDDVLAKLRMETQPKESLDKISTGPG